MTEQSRRVGTVPSEKLVAAILDLIEEHRDENDAPFTVSPRTREEWIAALAGPVPEVPAHVLFGTLVLTMFERLVNDPASNADALTVEHIHRMNRNRGGPPLTDTEAALTLVMLNGSRKLGEFDQLAARARAQAKAGVIPVA